MENICQPYRNTSIYKIIWKHNNKDNKDNDNQIDNDTNNEHKYIFVGARDKNLVTILTKYSNHKPNKNNFLMKLKHLYNKHRMGRMFLYLHMGKLVQERHIQ